MPVLPDEPDTCPADLFAAPPGADGLRWWVAHTRPRQEKALARDLTTADRPFFLPCHKRRTKIGGRVIPVTIPIFTGYLFVRSTDSEKWRILATKRVAHLLPVADQEQLWTDLRRVRAVLDLGRPVRAEQHLDPGTRVTVRDGPLAGLTGTVVREAGGFRFVVAIDFIRQGVSITVDGEWLGVAA